MIFQSLSVFRLARIVQQSPATRNSSFTFLCHRCASTTFPLLTRRIPLPGPRTSIIVRQCATKASGKKFKYKKSDLFRLLQLAAREKWVIAGGIGCLIVSSSITMAVPYGLGKILDTIYTDESKEVARERLKKFCLILAGIFIIGGISNFGRVYLFNSASLRIVQDIRSRLYRAMLSQEAGWFDQKGTGELVNRLSQDSYLVGNSLSQNMSDGLRSTVMVTAGVGMMVHTSPHLALVGMCVVPAVAGMAVVYGRYVRNITKSLLDQYAAIMKTGEERLGNIKTVKMFCREEQESQLFLSKLYDALHLGYMEVRARAIFYGLTGLSGNILIMSVLFYGGNMVANEELTVGALTSFILYAGYSAISINGLSNFYTELNKGLGAAQRIWEIFDRQPLIPVAAHAGKTLPSLGAITFRNVAFNYPSRPDNPVLVDLNLTIDAGTTTAVVGKSGSGKSTIGILLLRLYDPTHGQVSLNGVDIRDLDPLWLRSNIGAVNQEPVLFSGTIRENILYGVNVGTRISEEDFQRIVREAHVDEFVRNLPQGLETIVGQRGMMLSGGQKQRVAIARALIKNPSILLLDEATSALDAGSEEHIQVALESLTKGRTVLTIAHRLSTIRNAQKIVVLDSGRIAEEGTYAELSMREEGLFRELVKRQTFQLH
uniref:ATP-binding cassette sub-family B member 10, mitochondrial n=1 Tax=Lutzomyia longipalpis TaxID=7200 RepID=A0A1B0GLA4_LUTLO